MISALDSVKLAWNIARSADNPGGRLFTRFDVLRVRRGDAGAFSRRAESRLDLWRQLFAASITLRAALRFFQICPDVGLDDFGADFGGATISN